MFHMESNAVSLMFTLNLVSQETQIVSDKSQNTDLIYKINEFLVTFYGISKLTN
jgi:hypothetical protein